MVLLSSIVLSALELSLGHSVCEIRRKFEYYFVTLTYPWLKLYFSLLTNYPNPHKAMAINLNRREKLKHIIYVNQRGGKAIDVCPL